MLAPGPLHLIKLRASQISGCAIRGHMHTGEAIKDGETDLRLRMLVARRESSLDTPRAVLARGEALTRLEQTCAPDGDWEVLTAEFNEAEYVGGADSVA
ncbi:carboxymuconolactone decarboxylase family protein [Pseudooceanicola spongiae]|uniref:carboxymuconolactone decarboxylase family protein n=1 Tax=Pseudooceanicola spongiae TaxID=2613965 RepID=UPI001866A2A6|nr:carboxymuconolactone decarboxylase family protein [Pseudooceanicola spongiae]